MFGLEKAPQDEKTAVTEKKIKEVERQLEAMKRESKQLYEWLGISAEQFDRYISKEEHFLNEDWVEIDKKMKELEKQLEQSLDTIKNPLDSWSRYQDTKEVQRGWLPCP